MIVEFTDEAKQDFLTINHYITYILQEPNVANKLIHDIFDKIELLQDYPYIGAVYKNYFNRYLTFKNYLIFYQIQKTENIILIKRILHKKMKR